MEAIPGIMDLGMVGSSLILGSAPEGGGWEKETRRGRELKARKRLSTEYLFGRDLLVAWTDTWTQVKKHKRD